jgi:hypothetical protein
MLVGGPNVHVACHKIKGVASLFGFDAGGLFVFGDDFDDFLVEMKLDAYLLGEAN